MRNLLQMMRVPRDAAPSLVCGRVAWSMQAEQHNPAVCTCLERWLITTMQDFVCLDPDLYLEHPA